MAARSAEAIIEKVLCSKKYRCICEETVRDICEREVAAAQCSRRRSSGAAWRRAAAAARLRLHRIWADYLGSIDYDEAQEQLESAWQSDSEDGRESACRRILSRHRSSHERLPVLTRFYEDVFSVTGRPDSLHDLACALNPFAFRWMSLPSSVQYRAYDINRRTVDLINAYFRLEGLSPLAEHRDMLCSPVTVPADVAFLLKMYHCLERRRKGAGWEVVAGIPVRWVVITFPGVNLAARYVDIARNYEPALQRGCEARGWRFIKMDLAIEPAILIEKR